ncbi:unnamed protein product [Spirodela intermedia]|uniref:WW domain-containing protein n=1 Tax=Spirodela intermedia TaxID=51605 RepID=A0A7I8IRD2_SPIIN|nr:unnamed protein product [Spirodela intermedia]CAA6660116.1 unnamed protein product [Spirodela intermedia]
MIGEFLRQKKVTPYVAEEIKVCGGGQLRRVMNMPELSLSPLSPFGHGVDSFPTESEANPSKKRKSSWDVPPSQTAIELQLKKPLPLDWEQCLDLQSGRMYYLNRKTFKRSWSWPKNQGLDLELNISPPQNSEGIAGTNSLDDSRKQSYSANSMVAVACLRCHLLVMLSRSSPSCPNCKYVHPLLPPAQQLSPSTVDDSPRSPETLSLLN